MAQLLEQYNVRIPVELREKLEARRREMVKATSVQTITIQDVIRAACEEYFAKEER